MTEPHLAPPPTIEYRDFREAWPGFEPTVRELITRFSCRRICEIGGGANPALPLDFIHEYGLDYLIVDISAEELAKAPAGYQTRLLDVCDPAAQIEGGFDLVFSKMLAEHVLAPEIFHENIRRLLRPGGLSFHFFPTLFAPPFVLNYLLPETLTESFLLLLQPWRVKTGRKGKFPAYYRWCRGPLASQLRRLETAGFETFRYVGFFGHGYYKKFPPLQALHRWLVGQLLRVPIPSLTTFAYAILRKPLAAQS